jgi:hypothetical protein
MGKMALDEIHDLGTNHKLIYTYEINLIICTMDPVK